jgi:hypothetical protein
MYYEFLGEEPDWADLKRSFKGNLSKYNVPYFHADSKKLEAFEQFCASRQLPVRKKTLIEYDGIQNGHAEFLYLRLRDDGGHCISPGPSFVDQSAACPGGGPFGVCGRGAKQIGIVKIERGGLKRIQNLGFIQTRHPWLPRILLISEEIARTLEGAKATGCEISPCDNFSHSSETSPEAKCYQLQITGQTLGPVRIGEAKLGKHCPVCRAVKLFFATRERYFLRNDLTNSDFQLCTEYQSDNAGSFETIAGFPIVSRRIFDLLLSHKVYGIDNYSSDPPVRHAVVQTI